MIGTVNKFDLNNFRLGQRRDSALRDDAMLSLRTLKNMDIIYSDGRLRTRKGYERWNSTALPAKATQLYHFVDLEGNEHLLGILDTSTIDTYDKWYVIKETGSHVVLREEAATARKAILGYGNRCIFATNVGFWWTDNTALATGTSYELGIEKPGDITAATATAEGHQATPSGAYIVRINQTDQRKVGIKFVPTVDMTLSGIYVSLARWHSRQDLDGSIKASFYTNSGSGPSSTLVDADAVSNYQAVAQLSMQTQAYKLLTFNHAFDLTAATPYWIVLEGNEAYYDNYLNLGGTADFYAAVGIEYNPGSWTYGPTQTYDQAGGTWSELGAQSEAVFYVGGLITDTVYDYVMTYLNSTYGIESRPSDHSRVFISASGSAVGVSGYPAPTDAQVDKVRFYRRTVGTGSEALDYTDDDITDEYKLVAELTSPDALTDLYTAAGLGGVLQTEDHYRFNDVVEDDRPVALVPYLACEWKGRIWFAEEDANILYFSKILEENGATGLIQDNVPDYFPLENKLPMPEASAIIAINKLPDDSLAVYFENETIWCIWGGDDVRNPPADFSYRRIIPNKGLYAPSAIEHESTGHVILGRHGLYRFSGIGIMEYLSETNQTILDDIENAYLLGSRLVVNGNEIWLLVDTDNDGALETIMILDLQRDLPTRQLRDRAWRMYEYDVTLNDLVVRKAGGEFRNILAADAENNYILSLNTGTLDYIYPIDTEIETQDLQAEGLVGISGLSLRANYVESAVSYKVAITDGDGAEHDFSLFPGSQGDLRGHRTGCRILAPNFVRVKVESSHVKQDEIRGISIDYVVE